MIRDEAGCMGRLVVNLLLLARGDEGCTIGRRPVELDVLLLEVAHIFDLPPGPGARRSGAGLGLAIARWIAEAHGGHVEVESTVGQGRTLTLMPPLSDRSLRHNQCGGAGDVLTC